MKILDWHAIVKTLSGHTFIYWWEIKVTLTSPSNNAPASSKRAFSPAISIPAGSLFGVEMSATSINAMHSISVSIQAQEA